MKDSTPCCLGFQIYLPGKGQDLKMAIYSYEFYSPFTTQKYTPGKCFCSLRKLHFQKWQEKGFVECRSLVTQCSCSVSVLTRRNTFLLSIHCFRNNVFCVLINKKFSKSSCNQVQYSFLTIEKTLRSPRRCLSSSSL